MRTTFASLGVRTIAVIEAAKALLVLLAGCGALRLLHRDAHQIAVQFIERLHLNPAHRFPHIFIDAASHVTDANLWLVASLALAYSLVRGIEAYGLWRARPWAEWFALAAGAIYLPVEIYELARGVSPIKLGALVVNVFIIVFMGLVLRESHQKKKGIVL